MRKIIVGPQKDFFAGCTGPSARAENRRSGPASTIHPRRVDDIPHLQLADLHRLVVVVASGFDHNAWPSGIATERHK